MGKKQKERESGAVITRLLEQIGQHKRGFLTGVVLFVVFCPFCTLLLMKGIDSYFRGDLLSVPEHISAWFGYSASYVGAVASIGIGLMTIELTMVIQRINSNEQRVQQQYSIATHMPDLACEKCVLYDNRQDYPYQYMDKMMSMKDYLLELHLTPAFPVYFDIEVKDILLRWNEPYVEKHMSKTRKIETKVELTSDDYSFTNNRDFDLSISLTIADDDRKAFQHFYESYLRSHHDYNDKENVIEVLIGMECRNVFLTDQEGTGDAAFQFCLTMENEGKIGNEQGILLQTIDRKMIVRR